MNLLDAPQVDFYCQLKGTSETRYFPLLRSSNRSGVHQIYYALSPADDSCYLDRNQHSCREFFDNCGGYSV